MLNIMIKRLIESRFVAVVPNSASMTIGGVQQTNDWLVITDVGRKYVNDLGLHEL